MRRYLLLCLLIVFIITGCAADKASENEPSEPVQQAAREDSGFSEEPSMTITEEKNNSESYSDILSEAGAGAAMSKEASIPSPEEDTVSSPEVLPVSDDAVPEEQAETENDAPADEENTETAGSTGIFTSSELSDDIKARITGVSYPPGCNISYDDLRYLQLSYVDFNGQTQLGEMICNKAVASDLLQIFSELYHAGYQIDKIKLIEEYGADDDLSCADNNTSCFNYRVVAGSTNLSKHAMGVAVDLNPFYNPYVTYPDGKTRISPPGSEPYADRSSDFPHKIDENDLAYKLFTQHGFTWGGHWKTLKDYQHFQKPL